MIVAELPTVAPWQAQADQLLAPSYFPTTARGSSDVMLMSKSASVINTPFGLRGVAFRVASSSVSHTAPHEPIGSGFTVGFTVTDHDASPTCALREAAPSINMHAAREAALRAWRMMGRVNYTSMQDYECATKAT